MSGEFADQAVEEALARITALESALREMYGAVIEPYLTTANAEQSRAFIRQSALDSNSIDAWRSLAYSLEQRLSDAESRIKFLEDGHTETSLHLIRADITAFGWNHEGVDKLAAERDLLRSSCRWYEAQQDVKYAVELRAHLEALLAHPSDDSHDAHWDEGRNWFLTPLEWAEKAARAALAKNPAPVASAVRPMPQGAPVENAGDRPPPTGSGTDNALTMEVPK